MLSLRTRCVPLLILVVFGCGDDPSPPEAIAGVTESAVDSLPLNQIQVIGSHNSYRLRTPSPLFEALQAFQSILPPDVDPKQLDYTHPPVDVQLGRYRVRSLELDFYHDPEGGRFYHRKGNALVGQTTASGIPELLLPGSKILHIPDIDFLSHVHTLLQGLAAVKSWSNAHPNHLPLFILMEPKDESLDATLPGLGFTKTLAWNADAMGALEQEIQTAFQDNPSKVFSPDELRGGAVDLPSAIASKGWPPLGQLRGRIVFLLFASAEQRAFYSGGSPPLQGRRMFPFSEPGQPDAAFVRYDDPVKDFDKVQAAVLAGYMVRTRADEGTYEARSGSTVRREKAFASGAQIVSTDYYRPDERAGTPGWSDYSVTLPQGASGRVFESGALIFD